MFGVGLFYGVELGLPRVPFGLHGVVSIGLPCVPFCLQVVAVVVEFGLHVCVVVVLVFCFLFLPFAPAFFHVRPVVVELLDFVHVVVCLF